MGCVIDIEPVAYVRDAPRALAGMAGHIVAFERAYRLSDALRDIEGFDYVWLLCAVADGRPAQRPTLAGQIEPLCVALRGVAATDAWGQVLLVDGAGLADGLAVYDVKPYVPYADAHADAAGEQTADERECEDAHGTAKR